MRYFTLKNKILLLLLGSILSVLLLVGVIFSAQVTQYYMNNAQAALRSSAELLHKDLLAKSQHLVDSARHTVEDENILATLNLIERYQDRDNYEAEVFDVEKRHLLSILDEMLHVGGFNLTSVYQADGSLIAFSAKIDGGELGGVQSYEAGRPQLLAGNGEAGLVSRLYAELSALPEALRHSAAVVNFREAPAQFGIQLETVVPFLLKQADGSERLLGWMRLSCLLDRSYLAAMEQKLEIGLAISGADDYLTAGTFVPHLGAERGVAVPDLQLTPGAATHVVLLEVVDGYEARMALPVDGKRRFYLVMGELNRDLSTNLDVFGRSVAWVLLLTGIVVIPLGVYLTHRWINEPLQLLTSVAHRITKGEHPRVTGFSQHDELGVLAEAFGVMSSAIMHRENELRDKQRQIEGIIDNAPAVIYIKDRDGRYQLINTLFEQLFSVSNEQLCGKTDSALFAPELAALIRGHEEEVFATCKPIQVEEMVPQNGTLHTYLSIKFPLFDDDHKVVAVCGISTDITERKRTENDLLLAKNIIENASEGVVVTNLDGVITDVNEAYERISGFQREEVIGKTPAVNKSGRHDEDFYRKMWTSIADNGYWQGEIWDRRKSGELYPKWLSINTVRDDEGRPSHYVGIFSDITHKKATEEQLERLAYFDALTELPNRTLFRDRLGQEIASARRHDERVALLFLDLDRFKQVNDTMGHAVGDELLAQVAQVLQHSVRESDTVSRLGGDEFTVILPEVRNADQVSAVAQKIIEEVAKPLHLHGQEIHIGTSIGVALFPEDGESIDALSRHADMALYKAKELGRNNYQFFSRDLQLRITERIALEEELRRALPRNEFSLCYQPKYHVASGKISGMEALVRWQQSERGQVSPSEFIPLAEETGLIIPIGESILREACRQTALWRQHSGLELKVAVNLSARQFHSLRLAETIQQILVESGLPPEALELELTESMMVDNVEQAIATMRRLRDLGLSLAIDDFGTGYSSLSYLKRFPINTLKIDQSFVRDLTVDSDDASIVQAIIAMGRQLELHVVAEGVETEEQLTFLHHHGCEEVQGYHLGRPLLAEEFSQLLGL